MITINRINTIGLAEIKAYLDDHLDGEVTPQDVNAWADDLAAALDAGKKEIEIRATWTKRGIPKFLSVSEEGVDKEEVADE